MIFLVVLVQIVAFYCLYNTSQRAERSMDIFSVWLQGHTLFSTLAGLLLLILSFWLMIIVQGLGVGIFFGFLSLMTCSSLMILIIPMTIRKN